MTRPEDAFTAQTPEQARLLLDLAYLSVLAVLIQTEAGAAEVANHTRTTVKQAHHKLSRLLDAGLIGMTGERKRGGRPIKLYRAVAGAYRVPFALTDAATAEELIGGRMEPFFRAYMRATAQHFTQEANRDLLIALDDRSQLSISLSGGMLKAAQNKGMYGTFAQWRLRRETREELERRLRELQKWISAQDAGDDPQAEECILGLLFTPGEVEGL